MRGYCAGGRPGERGESSTTRSERTTRRSAPPSRLVGGGVCTAGIAGRRRRPGIPGCGPGRGLRQLARPPAEPHAPGHGPGVGQSRATAFRAAEAGAARFPGGGAAATRGTAGATAQGRRRPSQAAAPARRGRATTVNQAARPRPRRTAYRVLAGPRLVRRLRCVELLCVGRAAALPGAWDGPRSSSFRRFQASASSSGL